MIGRYWRRLLHTSANPPPSAPSAAGLAVVSPPDGFGPRQGELVHAQSPAQGRDSERGIDLGLGTVLVTSRGVVFFTGAKRWRFAWRGIDGFGIENTQSLEVETRSGRHFSFRLRSAAEAESMLQTARTAWANRAPDDRH